MGWTGGQALVELARPVVRALEVAAVARGGRGRARGAGPLRERRLVLRQASAYSPSRLQRDPLGVEARRPPRGASPQPSGPARSRRRARRRWRGPRGASDRRRRADQRGERVHRDRRVAALQGRSAAQQRGLRAVARPRGAAQRLPRAREEVERGRQARARRAPSPRVAPAARPPGEPRAQVTRRGAAHARPSPAPRPSASKSRVSRKERMSSRATSEGMHDSGAEAGMRIPSDTEHREAPEARVGGSSSPGMPGPDRGIPGGRPAGTDRGGPGREVRRGPGGAMDRFEIEGGVRRSGAR